MESTTYQDRIQTADAAALEHTFLKRTYLHLLAAVAVFVGVELLLFITGIAQALAPVMSSNWLIVLSGFMLLGFLTRYFTSRKSSQSMQYVELGVTILLQAIIFIPLLTYAVYLTDASVLSSAVTVTLVIFTGMTAMVAYTGKDFSFLGPFLAIIGIAALLAIVGSILFGAALGFYFSLAMVVFAAAVVLYETSKIKHNYGTDEYVAAATGLFASVALLFYYVLMTFVSGE